MRYAWILPAVLLAAPAYADAPAKEDNRQVLSTEDAQRLAKLLYAQAAENRAVTWKRYQERQENVRQLRAAIYAPSPDMTLIERLRQRERVLRREQEQETDENSERFMTSLSPEDRIKYLKMLYPGPVMFTTPN